MKNGTLKSESTLIQLLVVIVGLAILWGKARLAQVADLCSPRPARMAA